MILFCLFLSPLVSPLTWLYVIWWRGLPNLSHHHQANLTNLETFARLYHSITACIEAPLQTLMTLYLMATCHLPLPWRDENRSDENVPVPFGVTDSQGNKIGIDFSMFSMVSVFFSVGTMIKCAIAINILSVYIGRSDFQFYLNLSAGHIPFFVHSILLRVFAYTFFFVYLNNIAGCIPILLIWTCNLLIGRSPHVPALNMLVSVQATWQSNLNWRETQTWHS